MAREIVKVLDRIRTEVPPDCVALLAGLQAVEESARYTAPETIWRLWGKLELVLSKEIGEPELDWQKRVAAIMRAEE
jgi:hypothetical protein